MLIPPNHTNYEWERGDFPKENQVAIVGGAGDDTNKEGKEERKGGVGSRGREIEREREV